MKLNHVIKVPSLLLSSVLLLSACGGGSDDPEVETLTGVFIDAPVQGAGFQTASNQGTTNEKGEFTYQAGESVSFFIQGIQIGSTSAQPKTPITQLPDPLILARIVQTLDHDPDPDKIDVTSIVLGDDTKNQLQAIIAKADGAPGLESVLTDAKLAEIQINSNVTLENQTLVSASDAASHLVDNVDPIAFTDSGFSNKFIVDSDGDGLGSDLAILTFDSAGSGSFSSANTASLNASLNQDGTVNFNIDGDNNYTVTQLSKTDNRTVVHIKNLSDGNEFVREFYGTLPLRLADMDGRHFALDMSNHDCSARTLSVNGNEMIIHTSCSDGFYKDTAVLSVHLQSENVIVAEFAERDGVAVKSMLGLVEGSLAEGQYGLLEYENSVLANVSIISWTEADAALTDPNFLEASDFANKFFVDSAVNGLSSNISVVTFDSSNTGAFLGQESNGDGYTEPFSWVANEDGTFTMTLAQSAATATQVSQAGNRRVINAKNSAGEEFTREWYEALPLRLADMSGKHFSMDTGTDSSCSARTLSFSGSNVTINESCSDGFFNYPGTVSEHSQLNNVLIIEFAGQGRAPEKADIALVQGTLANGSYGVVEYAGSSVDSVYTVSLSETDAALSQ